MDRTLALPRAVRLPRPPRVVVALLALVAVLAGGFLLVRDSSLVAVEDVRITGVTGPEAPRIRELLTQTARDMTTLNLSVQQLEDVVAGYPLIAGISAQTDFPHGLRIAVRERKPVAAVEADGVRTLVAADGRLLPRARRDGLPVVPLATPPGGERVVERRAVAAIRVVAAAPAALRSRIEEATTVGPGVVVRLDEGPELRFGGSERAAQKWTAVTAVLADASSAGATYIDVRYPARPAAGGLEDPQAQQRDPLEEGTAAPEGTTAGTPPVTTP